MPAYFRFVKQYIFEMFLEKKANTKTNDKPIIDK